VDYLLDTNTLSALIGTNETVINRISRVGSAEYVFSSVITEGELMFGVANAPTHKREWLAQQTRTGLRAMAEIVPIDSAAAEVYGEVKYHLKVTGQPLPDNDIWIAAVAMANGYTLVFHDAAFARIPGLILEDWLA
jgi:tRNA(fMet)-specific endonuclease VapC